MAGGSGGPAVPPIKGMQTLKGNKQPVSPPGGGVKDVLSPQGSQRSKSPESELSYDSELANETGIKMFYPMKVAEIMNGETENLVKDLMKYVKEIIHDPNREKFYVCDLWDNLTDANSVHHDPNFCNAPNRAIELRRKIRDNWRDWSGSWRKANGEFLEDFRPMQIGDVKFDKVSVNNYDAFE